MAATPPTLFVLLAVDDDNALGVGDPDGPALSVLTLAETALLLESGDRAALVSARSRNSQPPAAVR